MKSRQLANVLFKVMGFWVCLGAIPSCVSGMLIAIQSHIANGSGFEVVRVLSYAIGSGVQLAIGIAVIAMSQKISSWLFKNDDE